MEQFGSWNRLGDSRSFLLQIALAADELALLARLQAAAAAVAVAAEATAAAARLQGQTPAAAAQQLSAGCSCCSCRSGRSSRSRRTSLARGFAIAIASAWPISSRLLFCSSCFLMLPMPRCPYRDV